MVILEPDPELVLRTIAESDAPSIFALIDANREHLAPWMPWAHTTRSPDDTLAFIRDVSARDAEGRGFALVIEAEDVPVGLIGLDPIDPANESASIGYWLAANAQGRGIMTRAVEAVLAHAFEDLDLNRVCLHAAVDNERSRAVAERVGFEQEGLLREAEKNQDVFLDIAAYAMLRIDYLGR
jgi:ribosomal-protein-serine acetyltransferase